MKTIQQVQSEIDALRKEFKTFFLNTQDKTANKARKRIDLLEKVVIYLESNPTEEFVTKERLRLADKLHAIRAAYDDYLANIDAQANVPEYMAKMGGKLIKDQQKVLTYIMVE
jgi:hypothetical protein